MIFDFGMIFFRADSLQTSIHMISNLLLPGSITAPIKQLYSSCWSEFGGSIVFVAVFLIILLQIAVDVNQHKNKHIQDMIIKMPFLIRWISYIVLIMVIVTTGQFGKSPFIYFGF